VRDISGAVVPGVAVTVRDKATNQTWQSLSAEDGTCRFAALPAGDYEVRSEVAGFTPSGSQTLTIPLGRTIIFGIILQPEGVVQSVTVTDQPPAIDPTATATSTTIDPERIEELPVNSRNYLEFTLLAPGVAPSNPQSSSAGAGQSASPLADSGFTFGGLRP